MTEISGHGNVGATAALSNSAAMSVVGQPKKYSQRAYIADLLESVLKRPPMVSAHRLPGELALLLADRITRVARRASIDRRDPVGCVLRNVRRDVEVAQIVDEVAHIEAEAQTMIVRHSPGSRRLTLGADKAYVSCSRAVALG